MTRRRIAALRIAGMCIAISVATFLISPGPAAAADGIEIGIAQQLGDPTHPDPSAQSLSSIDNSTGPGARIRFRVLVDYHCRPADSRKRLFVSMADIVTTADVSKLPSPQTLDLEVPWQRLQWLDGAAACREKSGRNAGKDQATAGGFDYFRLPSRAVAFATLSCAGPGSQPAMTTRTIPMDLWLRCPSPASDEAGTAPASDAGQP